MHIVVEKNESGPYLDAFFALAALGCTRFLICGRPPSEFEARVSRDPGFQALTIRRSTAAGDVPGSDSGFATATDQALTHEKWDAVMLFGSDTLQAHTQDLRRIASTCHLVYHKHRAEHPIVVSLNKSGTNLVARLIRAFNYNPLGEGVRESYGELQRLANDVPNYPFQGAGAMLPLLLRKAPASSCLFFHLLPTGPHLGEWVHHPSPPPILFHYRDPRALIVSLIHYLTGKAREDFTSVPWYEAHSRMLSDLPTAEARIDYAISQFGDFLDQAYRQHAWLLRHPAVYQSSYERLVGEAGGGSEESQLSVVSGAMLHFGVGGDPKEFTTQLYDRSARTFRKGQVMSWRDEFSPGQIEAFKDMYHDILELYGYE